MDNKCRAFTSLEQSRKLAEILSLESADMYYEERCNLPKAIVGSYSLHIQCRATDKDYKKLTYPVLSPCWSLAALLEQLPEIINYEDDESDYALEISKENDLYYLSYGNPFEHGKLEVEPQENFVDACYEMIIKLHEQKLL